MERYQLSLHATQLPDKGGLFRVSSPYAQVKITSGPNVGKMLGETEPVPHGLNPDWVKILTLEFTPSEITNLEVTIWDYRNGKEPLWLGEANFEATSVYQEAGHTKSQQIGKRDSSRYVLFIVYVFVVAPHSHTFLMTV
jgi:hypothetical protein